MQTRRASIKETGEELSQADWKRFDAAVAEVKAERSKDDVCAPTPTDRTPDAPVTPQS